MLEALRRMPVTLAAGTLEATCNHTATLIPRIRLLNSQIADAHRQLDRLTGLLASPAEPAADKPEQHAATILASLPGVGRIVLATLLAEAWDGRLSRQRRMAARARCRSARQR